MREGIAYAGNLIVDRIRRIDRLPRRSELAAIHGTGRSTGGACNGAISMKLLAPELPVHVYGVAGAGDAFCAGALLAAYRGLPVWDALCWGNAAAVQSLRADTSNGSVVPIEECLTNYDALSSEG